MSTRDTMRLKARLAGLAQWLFVDPKAVWAALLVPIVAVYASKMTPLAPEAGVRAAGFLITLAGVLLVAHGIAQTQREFNNPSIRHRSISWLKRLVALVLPAKPIHGTANVTLPMITVNAKGTVRVVPDNPLSVESRVNALEENLKRIDERISKTESRFEGEVRTIRNQLQIQGQYYSRDLEALRAQVKEQSTGSLDWEIVGAVWVVVGQALDSFPGEIAALIP